MVRQVFNAFVCIPVYRKAKAFKCAREEDMVYLTIISALSFVTAVGNAMVCYRTGVDGFLHLLVQRSVVAFYSLAVEVSGIKHGQPVRIDFPHFGEQKGNAHGPVEYGVNSVLEVVVYVDELPPGWLVAELAPDCITRFFCYPCEDSGTVRIEGIPEHSLVQQFHCSGIIEYVIAGSGMLSCLAGYGCPYMAVSSHSPKDIIPLLGIAFLHAQKVRMPEFQHGQGSWPSDIPSASQLDAKVSSFHVE